MTRDIALVKAALEAAKSAAQSQRRSFGLMGTGSVDCAIVAIDRLDPAAIAAGVHEQRCVWSGDNGQWASECGRYWEFFDGGPEDNGVTYCHHCGKRIEVLRVGEETDAD